MLMDSIINLNVCEDNSPFTRKNVIVLDEYDSNHCRTFSLISTACFYVCSKILCSVVLNDGI